MAFFKKIALPTTSYNYVPPLGATAHGWTCPNSDCGATEHEPVRRWPKQCDRCGTNTDPLFDRPWAHDAEGAELQHVLEGGGDEFGFYQTRWKIWEFKDALAKSDRQRAAAARAAARAYAVNRMRHESSWVPGDIFFHLVWYELEAQDLEWAADDLLFWFGVSSTEDVETNNTNRTNSRQVIAMTARFIDAGGSSHCRMPEIKAACLKLAEAARPVLNRDLQTAVVHITRV